MTLHRQIPDLESLLQAVRGAEVLRTMDQSRDRLIAFVGSLGLAIPWAGSFIEELRFASTGHDLEARTWQMLARLPELVPERLHSLEADGSLGPGLRAWGFARLPAASPARDTINHLRPRKLCPVSAALLRWREPDPSPEARPTRAQHRFVLEQAGQLRLGFAELVLEEARSSTGDPVDSLEDLSSLGLLVNDPLLAHEHPEPDLLTLTARWHLYMAWASFEAGDSQLQELHLRTYTQQVERAIHDPELVTSGYELLATISLQQHQTHIAERRIRLAIQALARARPEQPERLSELLRLLPRPLPARVSGLE